MWLDNLKRMKAESGLTTKEISLRSGIPEPTLEKLFAGSTKDPKLETMRQIVHFFGHTLDDLDDTQPKTKTAPSLSDEAMKLAKNYEGLDRYGKEVVDAVLDIEHKRVKEQDPTRITMMGPHNTLKKAGRDGHFLERELTEHEAAMEKGAHDRLDPITDELV